MCKYAYLYVNTCISTYTSHRCERIYIYAMYIDICALPPLPVTSYVFTSALLCSTMVPHPTVFDILHIDPLPDISALASRKRSFSSVWKMQTDTQYR